MRIVTSRVSRYGVPTRVSVRHLVAAIADTIVARRLSLVRRQNCAGTLSKVLGGRNESVTIDKLVGRLAALGRTVVRIGHANAGEQGTMRVLVSG